MRSFLWIVMGGLVVAAPVAAQPFFLPMGDLPTGEFESYPYGISADGTTVVGSASVLLDGNKRATTQAFRWTHAQGMVSLGALPGFTGDSVAKGVSADGGVVVGDADVSILTDSNTRAFVWTSKEGMALLELLPGTARSRAIGVSSDGTIIAGRCDSTAVRWVNGTPQIAAGLSGTIHAISADGTTMVGIASGGAFRWREETGMVLLGRLPGATFYWSSADCVSADGSVVVGYSDSGRSPGCCIFEVFRWTEDEGMQGLSFLGRPQSASADCSAIGGGLHSPNPAGNAFRYEGGEYTNVRHLLASYRVGPEIYDWVIGNMTGMTPDGNTFVGTATDTEGRRQAFIASIGEFCLLDWNRSGSINSQDFFDFMAMFFNGEADYTGNGVTNSSDWFAFLEDWRFQDCD